MTDLTPCQTCPWLKSNEPGGKGIPNFDIELMRRLSNTVGEGDAFRPVMACHYSPCGGETACRGYVARHGWSNLNVRVLAMKGVIDIKGIVAACKGLKLWKSFAAMLRAFEKALKK